MLCRALNSHRSRADTLASMTGVPPASDGTHESTLSNHPYLSRQYSIDWPVNSYGTHHTTTEG